jgi:hypothetical protein
MIGFLLHHGLSYYYLKTNNTTNVLSTIEKISKYVSCVIYVVLALVFWNYSIPILCISIFEHLSLSMLPVPKTWAAFELVRIDADNKGWNVDESGYIMTRKKVKVNDASL